MAYAKIYTNAPSPHESGAIRHRHPPCRWVEVLSPKMRESEKKRANSKPRPICQAINAVQCNEEPPIFSPRTSPASLPSRLIDSWR